MSPDGGHCSIRNIKANYKLMRYMARLLPTKKSSHEKVPMSRISLLSSRASDVDLI